ncbi:MAG: hypothetical protein NTX63_05045 [Candidatus Peregrinibacteria bacterium]|nr:hypothetical protein [Candidatus Peregrinibacteria bacterium]
MYTLALDTTGYKIHLALFKNDTLVFERDWRSNMNEDETITKTLQHLNELEPFYMQKLTKIIINEGPGTLTGTRVGVTMANALSYACKAPLVKLSTSQIWKTRLHEETSTLNPHLLLRITEQDLYLDDEIITLADLSKQMKKMKKKPFAAFGELTPTQFTELNKHRNVTWIIEPDLLPFSSAIAQLMTKSGKGDMKYAKPKYAKEPVITESKKEVLIPRHEKNAPAKKVKPVKKSKPVIAKKQKPAQKKKITAKSKPSRVLKIVKKVASKLSSKKKSKR